MQVLYLVNIFDVKLKRDGIALFVPFYFFLLTKIFKQEITLYDVFIHARLVDVLYEIDVEDLPTKKNIWQQKFIYLEGFIKALREALDYVVL